MDTKDGHLHPLTHTINDSIRIFSSMGFSVTEGPEMDTEHYNFDVLNVPKDHPARDMQDTFWVKGIKDTVMRTQTSNTQVRYMEKNEPPLRIIVPGKVFRNEATDATHEAQFHQIEGLMIGKDVTLGHLKGTLEEFFSMFLGGSTKVRFRPGYFPFVEPGVEVDAQCFKCGGEGCSLCKQTGWIEILGAGMVHPNVLRSGGVDPDEWQGFAFGIGADRLTLLKYGIDDIRHFYTTDLRVINQF